VRLPTLICCLAGCGGVSTSAPSETRTLDDAASEANGTRDVTSIPGVHGSVDGTVFEVADSAAEIYDPLPNDIGYPEVKVTLLDMPGACQDLQGGTPGTRALRIYIYNERDQTPIGPGTYVSPLPDAGGGAGSIITFFVWHNFGLGCTDVSGWSDDDPRNTVTLTEISSVVRGSFDVTLIHSVGHLAGSFVASLCPPQDAGTARVCQ